MKAAKATVPLSIPSLTDGHAAALAENKELDLSHTWVELLLRIRI